MKFSSLTTRLLGRRNSHTRKTRRAANFRRSALQLESLESRAVFSVSPLLATCNAPAPSADEVHVVFAPDTPREVVAAYKDLEQQKGFDAFTFNDSQRWSRTVTNGSGLTQGDPTIIRWSVAQDSTPISGYNGEPAAPSNLRSYLAGIYGSNPSSSRPQDQPWFSPLQRVFDRWGEVSGVTYVYEPADDGAALGSSASGLIGVRGDVRLSGHYIDGPSNILAYNFYPTVGDMVLDTGDTFFNNIANNSLRLRNTLAHEAGHGLGLGHVSPTNGTKLMEPSISLGFDGPQQDDILAINRGYGDRLEKNGGNNSAATATSLGAASSFTIDTVSIDDDSDVDWFQFTVGAGAAISATVAPTGTSYTSNGATFDALAQSNLALAIYGNGGATLIASANIAGAGVAETLSSIALPGSGTYYVRITGAANAAQMYRLTGSITGVSIAPEIALLDGSTDIPDNAGAVSFGSVEVGQSSTKTFTIQNLGTADLTLGSTVSVPAGFTLTQAPDTTTLVPGATTTIVVALYTSVAGTFSGALSLANNDATENPFNFTVSGTVTANPTPAPEIAIADGSTIIADGTGSVSFGSLTVGATATKVFTVSNSGDADLTLGALTLPVGFTLTDGPDPTIAAGGSTTFTIALDTTATGIFSGSLSLVNNDANEGPFNFTLSGTVTASTPSASFSDNFNRPNSSSLGSNWTERAGNVSISNSGLVNSTSGTSVATVNNLTLGDVVLTADVNLGIGSSSRDMGVVARHSGSGVGNQYLAGLSYSGGTFFAQIWEANNGRWTRLSSTPVASGVGSIRFELLGSSLKLYVNGVLTNSVTDSTITSGRVGVSATGTGARLDNFAASQPSAAIVAAAQTVQARERRAALDQLMAVLGSMSGSCLAASADFG